MHHCFPRGHEDQKPNQNRQSYYDASTEKLAACLNTGVEIVGDNIVSAVFVVFWPALDVATPGAELSVSSYTEFRATLGRTSTPAVR